MSDRSNRYWRSLEERDATGERSPDEFPSGVTEFSRRGFLKAAGFTLAVTAASCARAPVQKAIPLLTGSEEMVPGRALWFATTCAGCSAGCGALAKVRDGRPIKLEGNPEHPISRAGLCATGQASILGLYDSQRLPGPLAAGHKSGWNEVDAQVIRELSRIRQSGGAVRFLSGTIVSPTLRAEIAAFLTAFPDARHVVYDPLSRSAILDAHAETHGARVLPRYRFERAAVIASFDADFLGTWISPVEFARGWSEARDLEKGRFAHHVHFEPSMSVTGAKADRRVAIRPGDTGALLTRLASRIAPDAQLPVDDTIDQRAARAIDETATRLASARGRSLVVCGSNDVRHQRLVNLINDRLGNYGETIDIAMPSMQAAGDDAQLAALLAEMRDGKVAVLFVLGVNPAFDLAGSRAADAIKRVPLVVSFAQRRDETAEMARFVCPEPHYLESWSDAEAVAGTVSLSQPAIHPVFDTRPVIESLSAWSGKPVSSYDAIRAHWQGSVYARQTALTTFDEFLDRTLHDGAAQLSTSPANVASFNARAVKAVASEPVPSGTLALVMRPNVAMLDGRNAYNPWLHELPDPITKSTWDNYVSIAPETAARLRLSEGDVVRVEAAGAMIELPVLLQPGQHEDVVAIPLGYGSRLSARFANIGPRWIDAEPSTESSGVVGANAAVFAAVTASAIRYDGVATIARTGGRRELALTQMHHTLSVPEKLAAAGGAARHEIVQETSLAAYRRDPHSGVEDREEKQSLWPDDHHYTGPRWGIVVDLAACTGCAGCVIGCQAENNIPVVGRDEVRRNREMHWIRIDRYYGDDGDGGVSVAHQPLMCQQCENAPCETVCPVLATVHTDEGLNAQVYNRCVGTRYCANNCPYKARRFNWFEYSRDDRLQNLVLNPDVAVRSRGVMEKCSFCVQRIQEAKIEAKREGIAVEDGAVQTACQQSCPTRAITFGDLNDPNSRVSKLMSNPRRYRLLSELNVRPAVGYLSLVRDAEESSNV